MEADFYGLLDRVMPCYVYEQVGQALLQRACHIGTPKELQTALVQARELVFDIETTTPTLSNEFQDLRFVITDRILHGSPVWAARSEVRALFMYRPFQECRRCAHSLHSFSEFPELPIVTQSYPEFPIITQSYPVFPSVIQSYPELPSVSQCNQEFSSDTQSYLELPRVTQSYLESPRVTQSYPELPRVTQSYPELPRVTQSYPKLPRVTQSHPELPRVAECYLELQKENVAVEAEFYSLLDCMVPCYWHERVGQALTSNPLIDKLAVPCPSVTQL